MTNVDKNEEIIELTDVVEEKPEEKTARVGPDQRSVMRSEPPKGEKQPLSPKYESEVRAMKEALKAGAQNWMAAEGVRVLERIARDMFPKIAAEILRQEIEKLKAEVERQE